MKRPERFSDIIGHNWLCTYLQEQITKGTLHHFLIMDGPEGLGKTSLADLIALSLVYGITPSAERDDAYKNVIVKGESNDFIKRFKCSEDGGKDVARLIKDEMHTTFTLTRPKVIICDECHGFTEQAQDVFLAETEFIDDRVYIIMLTTEVNKLKASLRSRAVPIHLNPLKQADMVRVLKNEVAEKNLNLQNEEAMLSMIAEWSQCKPRTGLNILNAFSNGSSVSINSVRELIGFMDVKDVIPLLSSLSGSMTFGLSYIAEMLVDDSIVSLVIECINVKSGQHSYKLKLEDVHFVRDQLSDVSVEQLIKFLYGITKHSKLSRTDIINAYIQSHTSYSNLEKPDTSEMLATENIQRANIQLDIDGEAQSKAPTLDELMLNSDIIGG